MRKMPKNRALATSRQNREVEPKLSAKEKDEVLRRARYYARKLKKEEELLSGNTFDIILNSFALPDHYKSNWTLGRKRNVRFKRERERIKAYSAIAMGKAIAQTEE